MRPSRISASARPGTCAFSIRACSCASVSAGEGRGATAQPPSTAPRTTIAAARWSFMRNQHKRRAGHNRAMRPPRPPAPLWRIIPLLAALALGACAHRPGPPAPAIVAVETWGGSAGAVPAEPQRIQRNTGHHGGVAWPADKDPADHLRPLPQWSRLSQRWADTPYHYVIAPDGRIFAARDPALPGDTNTDYEPRGHALLMP